MVNDNGMLWYAPLYSRWSSRFANLEIKCSRKHPKISDEQIQLNFSQVVEMLVAQGFSEWEAAEVDIIIIVVIIAIVIIIETGA